MNQDTPSERTIKMYRFQMESLIKKLKTKRSKNPNNVSEIEVTYHTIINGVEGYITISGTIAERIEAAKKHLATLKKL